MIRYLMISWLILSSMFAQANEPIQGPSSDKLPFDSLVKLYVHQQVQDIRDQKAQIKTFMLESHVRKVKMDITLTLRRKGFLPQEIQNILSSNAYQDLFDRIRNSPRLNAQTDAFLTQITKPYYLEDRIIEKQLLVTERFGELLDQARTQDILRTQQKLLEIKTKPKPKQGFWTRLVQQIKNFSFG